MKKPDLPPFVALWLLLFVTLVVFLIYSFSDSLSLGTTEIKQSTFKDHLLSENIDQTDSITPDSLSLEAETHIEGPDTTVHKVLLFGDSMTILVANRIAYYGEQNNYDVVSVTWYSSSTKVWGETDTLSYFIKEYQPDFIIATLGANELFIRDIDQRKQYVQNLMKQCGKIPLIWIGPPNWKDDTGINDMLASTLPKGTFFLTKGIEMDRISDHVHPTQKAADLWADSIMRWIPSTPHPILSSYPDSVKGKPKHTVKLLSPPK